MHDTPNGAVLYGIPSRHEKKGPCIIEGTSWQLVMPDEFLQRYSDMVREGHKQALTKAINLILPGIQDIELLTDKTGIVLPVRKYIHGCSTAPSSPWRWGSPVVQAVFELFHRP